MGEFKLKIVPDTMDFHNEIERCKKELIELDKLGNAINNIKVKFGKRNWLQKLIAKLFSL